MSILAKLLSLIISTVVGLVAALVLVSYFLIADFEEVNVQNLLSANQKTVQKELDTSMRNSLLAGTLLGPTPILPEPCSITTQKRFRPLPAGLLTNQILIS